MLKDEVMIMHKCLFPPTAQRVRMNTSREVNDAISDRTLENMRNCRELNKEELSERIDELDMEWDIERCLETSAAAITLGISLVGLVRGKRGCFLLSGLVSGFLMTHALEGCCPPLPILRKWGIRTSSEINEEKHYLKYLRGDYHEK